MLSFFPRGVLDEIFNLIESVSEDFPSYSLTYREVTVFVSTSGMSKNAPSSSFDSRTAR